MTNAQCDVIAARKALNTLTDTVAALTVAVAAMPPSVDRCTTFAKLDIAMTRREEAVLKLNKAVDALRKEQGV